MKLLFELGVTLGPDTSHHLQMVRIGGEITKRLVRMAEKTVNRSIQTTLRK